MLIEMKLTVAGALLFCSGVALGQTNLGELLDAGAKPLSAAEFKEVVVQRMIFGPTPTGGAASSHVCGHRCDPGHRNHQTCDSDDVSGGTDQRHVERER